jgi:hypothetical protein
VGRCAGTVVGHGGFDEVGWDILNLETAVGRPARARSAFTQAVKLIEARKANAHTALVKIKSGQLPFPGSNGSRKCQYPRAFPEGFERSTALW